MAETNPNSRLEAFCDGVFAIALTLLIIDIKIPHTEEAADNHEMWLMLKHIIPNILSFLLSFVVILITWVNHHGLLKLVNKSTPHFIYANGLMLLTVVFVPFPTALIGDTILTNHAVPAVVLYSGVFAVQAVAWGLVGRIAVADGLCVNEHSQKEMAGLVAKSWYAISLYGLCTVLAFWFPLPVAIAAGISWLVWLIIGINIKHDRTNH